MINRRDTLRALAATAALGVAGGARAPAAVAGEPLSFDILGFTLDIHVPAIAALNEGLPALGYPKPKLARISSLQVLTQSIIAGGAETGESDVITPLRAVTQGADLKIVGMVYASSDLVWLANAAKIKTLADFGKPAWWWRSTPRATSPRSCWPARC
jgi:NitT/TauT family transport system substrate-binding protein